MLICSSSAYVSLLVSVVYAAPFEQSLSGPNHDVGSPNLVPIHARNHILRRDDDIPLNESNKQAILNFQVSQPVLKPQASEGEGEKCATTQVLMDHAFAHTYYVPYVGKLLRYLSLFKDLND